MKVSITPEEFQTLINTGLWTKLIVGNRTVSSVQVPGRYSPGTDVVIVFEDPVEVVSEDVVKAAE